MIDIYFDNNYGKLYEKIEKGTNEIFEFKSDLGIVRHQFIKREIPLRYSNGIYYDLITPYGYGGPVILEVKKGKEFDLIEEFGKEFERYCKSNNIVSEFVRFHPVFKNGRDFKQIYDVSYIRDTIGTNLIDYDDPFQTEFSKSCRKNIRKALKNGVTFKVTEKPSSLNNFKEVYYSTMDRNNASDYYYFDDEYFNNCFKYFRNNLLIVEAIYNEKVIAMGFYFIYDGMIHIHLSGTLSEYLFLSPAYILRYAVTLWGKENGYNLIHHGGGRTNDEDDTLYLFKKQFGKNTSFRFEVGKKIWNKSIYHELCKQIGIKDETEYFPAYRR